MNSADNCNNENIPKSNTNHNNNIEQDQDDSHRTADQALKHESSGSTSTVNGRTAVNEIDDMKRAHAKQLIERYFYQLSTGCSNTHCTNSNCASSGQFEALTPNQAAVRSIQLYKEDAKLCDFPANKTARISNESVASIEPAVVNDEDFDDIYR